MFTVIMTIVGLIVFAFSFVRRGFKTAFWRLIAFIFAGVIVDVVIIGAITGVAYHSL